MSLRRALLHILNDGGFHSGTRLGAALGVSRGAVWKQLQALAQRGVEIHAVRGRGYRLARPLELLDREQILAALPAGSRRLLAALEIHEETHSTNRLLAAVPRSRPAPRACLAEYQSAGRGRHGRSWVSPYGANLYMSLLWRFAEMPSWPATLGLAAGVAVMRTLADLGFGRLVPGLGLKWPNDVLWEGAKLGGVLAECSGEVEGRCQAVVGVGLNVHMPEPAARGIDQRWADLAQVFGGRISRNRCAARLLHHLLQVLADYERAGFVPLAAEWRRYDLLRDRPVRVVHGDRIQRGVARGIDSSGALVLEAGGRRCLVHAGEVSLRPEAVPARAAAEAGGE